MANVPTPFEALQEAVARMPSQEAFGDVCSMGQPAVSKMLSISKKLRAECVIAVEEATGVSRHHLRPDIYPLPRGTRPPEFVRKPRRAARRAASQVAAA